MPYSAIYARRAQRGRIGAFQECPPPSGETETRRGPFGHILRKLKGYIHFGPASYVAPPGRLPRCGTSLPQRGNDSRCPPSGVIYSAARIAPEGQQQHVPPAPKGAVCASHYVGARIFILPSGALFGKAEYLAPSGSEARKSPQGTTTQRKAISSTNLPPAPKGAVCARPFGERINISPKLSALCFQPVAFRQICASPTLWDAHTAPLGAGSRRGSIYAQRGIGF